MRKAVVMMLVLGLVAGSALAPAAAKKKKKKVTEEYSFAALPDPDLNGCNNGIENVHYQTHEFKTPGKGNLDLKMNNFIGDWDLFVLDDEGNVLGSSTGFIDATEERVVLPLGAKETITILGCNWSGGPTAEAQLTYTY